jgi:hypothetical protein
MAAVHRVRERLIRQPTLLIKTLEQIAAIDKQIVGSDSK